RPAQGRPQPTAHDAGAGVAGSVIRIRNPGSHAGNGVLTPRSRFKPRVESSEPGEAFVSAAVTRAIMTPPLVDTHCHLLAGLDDGPRTPEDAVAMCRRAYDQGVRHSVALAHQNEDYPDNTPQRLRAAFAQLVADLKADGLD